MKIEVGNLMRITVVAIAVVLSSACATPSEAPKPNLVNVPQPKTSQGEIFIGPFIDERSNIDEVQSPRIGTVRGGFGNVLAKLIIDKPVTESVSETVGNVLRDAGYHTNPIPATLQIQYSNGWKINGAPSSGSAPVVVGRIKNFWGWNGIGSAFGHGRSIEIDLEICIIDLQSRTSVKCDTVKGEEHDGGQMAGIGMDYAKVAVITEAWLTRLAEDSIKNYVAKTPIIQIWKDRQTKKNVLGQPNQIAAPQLAAPQPSAQPEDRLVKLQQLREKNLITEDEYRQMRGDILKGL